MNILITGATGFVGRALCLELCKRGHQLTAVTRDPRRLQEGDWQLPIETLKWNPSREDCPISLDPFDAVIHLMGESLTAGRWTDERKQAIYDSRVGATKRLLAALDKRTRPLPLLISASAIGYYPTGSSEAFDEAGPTGTGFLAKVCRDWEAAASGSERLSRTVLLRIGVVLGAEGGALEKMLPPFKLGVGGPLGNGRQMMSWIHRDDLVKIICQSLEDQRYEGPINCVAPHPVSNRDFTAKLGHVLHRPTALKVPSSALKLALGEMAGVLLESQAVVPRKLEKLGFRWDFPELEPALSEACNVVSSRGRSLACLRLSAAQFVPRPLEEVFDFFCDPKNLERITPPLLKFHIKNISSQAVSEGTIINYRLRVRGVPMGWRTRIAEWKENQRFVDIQEAGPYRIWHHTHEFFAVPGGTLMTDVVRYKVPLGVAGDIVALPIVRRDVRQIFGYRKKIIAEIFQGS